MSEYILDTNILILHLRNRPDITNLLKQWRQSGKLYISTVVRTELITGMHPHEEERTLALLDSLVSLPVDSQTADLAGRLMYRYARRGITLGLPDTLIAATAIVHNLTLATSNVKHFPIPELEIYPLTE